MNRLPTIALLSLLLLTPFAATFAGVLRTPAIFGHNMVLQQEKTLPVWGWSQPGEAVQVTFNGQSAQTTTGKDGRWRVDLKPINQSVKEPSDFIVESAGERLVYTNAVVGEVWHYSGQSNMEYTLRWCDRGLDEAAAANYPLMRVFKIGHLSSDAPEEDIKGRWVVVSPKLGGAISGVAYYSARLVHKATGRPFGIIDSSWSGIRIEPYIAPTGLLSRTFVNASITNLQAHYRALDPHGAEHKAALEKYIESVDAWVRETRERMKQGRPPAAMPEMNSRLAMALDANGVIRFDQPASAYFGMIAPIIPYAIRGMAWYQGCMNAFDGDSYREKLIALAEGYHDLWGQGPFPFYIMQIAPFNWSPSPTTLPDLWEAMTKASREIPNAGIVPLYDNRGANFHPTNKILPGERLGRQMLGRNYPEGKDVHWQSPVFREMKVEGDKARICFDFGEGLKTRDGKPIEKFQISDCSKPWGPWYDANARIEGDTVVIWHEKVKNPRGVTYGWNHHLSLNLVNQYGEPALVFRYRLPKKQ
ncbi:MAG: hypothetical protein ACI4X9_05755 [Kiritimatiellia bacterium]